MPTFRYATLRDAATLAVFAERMFVDAFAAENTPEDTADYCASAFGVDVETRNLTDPTRVCLLVERDDALVGYAYLLLGSASPHVDHASPVEIQRFYVDRRWHGRGLAQRLMNRCISDAIAHGGRTLWLGVWERNARAIRFYERCGFRRVGTQQFQLGSDQQNDLVMSRVLAD